MALATDPGGSSRAVTDGSLWKGLCLMVVVAVCSAVAGVSNEKLIKASPSVVEANVWLYAYGCIACFGQLLVSTGFSPVQSVTSGQYRQGYFQGFTTITWMVVLCNAVLGQSIA